MCGATAVEDLSTEGIDVKNSTVIQGQVLKADEPVEGAYVRLLDASGEFTAEVVTTGAGAYRFFARPGAWTLRALAPGGATADVPVAAVHGEVNSAEIAL